MKTSKEAKQAAVNIRQWLAAHVDTSNKLSQTELSERIQVAIDASTRPLLTALRAIEDYPRSRHMTDGGDAGHAVMSGIAREAIKTVKD